MASRKAIISSKLPVVREILNEENAIFADPEAETEWVNAINRLRDEDLRERLAQKAYQDFIERHTWTRRAKLVFF